MSPEIVVSNLLGKRINIDIPDKTGTYKTPLGKVSVDMSLIDPASQRQVLPLVLEGVERLVFLSRLGEGSFPVVNGGFVHVRLHEPIRPSGEWKRKGHGVYTHYVPRTASSIEYHRRVHARKPNSK